MPTRHPLRLAIVTTMLAFTVPASANPDPSDWQSVVAQAEDQTVYWNAWGGDTRTNRYIDWVAKQMQAQYDVEVEHVKLDDTGSAVARVLAEKQAGNNDDGSIDLIWINGENFAAMRESDLLFGPFAESLPHFALTNATDNPEVVTDFTLPTEGYESPWGKAQITFYYDSAQTETPPQDMQALLAWTKDNPGQFSYPRIPDFTGSTFLKQALIELTDQEKALYQPVSESDFEAVTEPLWAYLDALHPHLWRSGRAFPDSGPNLRTLMSDGEISLAFSFYPTDAAVAVMEYELPESVRSYVLEGGTLGNVHFVAIPYNSPHKAGAMVLANFLLSPEAQAQKQSLAMWGDRSVLDIEQLDAETQTLFEQGDRHPSELPADALSNTLPEPHPSWMTALQNAWLERYGVN
ncbi:ABC transporter substrate-binding protein [Vreelandella neptunia]|uniref:ABC transporter substrate-binding protein n=1 Tax=Vreelandella neptunia TaxID=115551 RepID=A0ABZ0YN49_9GAMM|nr:ABC transporter substrate-binding protein [Halomonas neptunia]MDN3558398.1 ABC transporter substrate-binding protein [Halomonas neptunia]TDV98603.1 putative thiamine transport system substrate-binding protein [Halomonas alkaliantarctica]WQH13373.1 ABC transporter substrate-binding protein [Halomonas neptunia]